MADDMSKYREMFVQETNEHLQALNRCLLELENNPRDKKVLDEAFRSAHTVKGMAATMGYDSIRQICASIEEYFDKFRKGEAAVSSSIAGHLFRCLDVLSQLINDESKVLGANDLLPLLHPESNTSAMGGAPPEQESAGETVISDRVIVAEAPYENPAASQPSRPQAAEPQFAIQKSATIRVRMDDMDTLIDLVGEIMIAKMRLEQSIMSPSTQEDADARQQIASLGRLISDLQYKTMKVRLVPAEQIFDRFPRMVRDLAATLHKDIRFELNWSGVELDRTVADAITDPLLHVLRNAIDHGMEGPDERIAKGKPRTGTIHLHTSRVGEKVVIDVTDDGRGIDLERVRAKAVENGIISKGESDSMSDNDAIGLIGTPGLSTSREVTDVSGRGVGMDVVFDKIEAVGGQVRIQTSKDKGTTITLVIPVSLAIIGGLVVTVVKEKYVIPISNVVSVLRPERAQVQMVNGREVITFAEKVIPIVPAISILDKPDSGESSEQLRAKRIDDKLTAVIIDINGRLIALTVDSVESKQDIVVKHVHKAGFETESTPTNATILPDGNVALVLDSGQLQERIR